MTDMIDANRVREIKYRLADRYTAAELCDLLDVPVEDLVEEYWIIILTKPLLLEEVGCTLTNENGYIDAE